MFNEFEYFCSETNSRQREPFVDDGYKYATDGMILICVKTEEPNPEEPHPRKVQELFERPWDEGWKLEKITLPDKSDENCCFCNGTGVRHFQCNVCEGTGEHKCDCGDDHECGYCEEGRVEGDTSEGCPQCRGTGKAYENKKYGPIYFKGYQLAKIAKYLSNPKVTEIATESHILRFEFDGGKGLLMGSVKNSYVKSA